MAKIRIELELDKCNCACEDRSQPVCPFCRVETIGRTETYYCAANSNKKIVSGVEWCSDVPAVPDWCPYIVE